MMRMIIGTILGAGVANTALAHTLDGDIVTAVGHQFFGSHHLLFTVALVALLYCLVRLWRNRDRV
jgi:NADH:ubiquinone oxidoreductase subunit 6 (subunit J)